jgi:tetratricopeptide (TPR) repeat protein
LAELDRLLAPLASDDVDKRRAAAQAVGDLGADATRAIRERLTDLRKAQDPPILPLVVATYKTATDDKFDLLDGLARSQAGGDARRIALSAVALLRALAHAGTTPAARTLIGLYPEWGGSFHSEIARLVHVLGERAIPALMMARRDSSLETRRWATSVLEALGKRVPGDAVQTKDNTILCDVLKVFAITHDMDAVNVVLSFVNSDRAQVRMTARDALNAYGRDAIWKLREAYTNLMGKPTPEDWPADRVARELFLAYDRFRLQEVYALLDAGLALQKEGKLDGAVADFDKVLARQPLLDRRVEMVPGYVQYAQSEEDKNPALALASYRKAQRLDPTGARSGQVESAILYLEGKDLRARGIVDADLFQRALKLDPGNAKARAELDRLEADSEQRQERTRHWEAAGAVLAMALAGIILFGGRSRRRRQIVA